MVRRLTVAIAVLALGMHFAGSVAQADTEDIIQPPTPESFDSGFQVGTCTADSEAGLPPEGPPPKRCSVETPGLFFTTAAGHPPIGYTQYIIEHAPYTLIPGPGFLAPIPGEDIKEHTIKTLRTDLPPGLTVNPEATEGRCSLADFLFQEPPGTFKPKCSEATRTGTQKITLVTNKDEVELEVAPGVFVKVPKGFVIPPNPGKTEIPIYNLVPAEGEPAKLGFVVNEKLPVFLETEVAWENDFHESFTIKLPFTAEATGLSTLVSRQVTNGATTGNGTYLTTPTTCFDPNEPAFEHLYSSWFRAESYLEPDPEFPNGSTAVEGPPPRVPPNTGERIQQDGCDTIPFEPSIEADAGTADIDSPAPATVTVEMPFDPLDEGGAANQSQSHMRRAEVHLPSGMGLNPSGSNGLVACTDAQFKKGVRVESNECPPASVIGTVEVVSPPLSEPLEGEVYVGEQQSRDPQSGDLFRILIEAKSAHEGIFARLVGNVKANPVNGGLTAVLTDKIVGQFAGALPEGLPQVPFESVKMHFEGSKEVLTSPPTCSPMEVLGVFEPWARPGQQVSDTGDLPTLTTDPDGGACPQTLAERRFAPEYTAKSDRAKAGAYSPFRVHIGRSDGQQEVKLVNVTLPKGLTGKLAGIPYCSEAAMAAAASSTGKAELAAPSCSSASQIGTTSTTAGTGTHPVTLPGKAYLAGPYKGAPLSMVVITPAVSGPFDLGTVVVRVAINVNPETAQINAVSDVIPDVFGGVKLDLRFIDVNVDRSQFMINPTNCAAQATSGTINGGGADPTNPAAFSAYAVSAPFRATECGRLAFKPKLFTRISGPVKRDKNPRLRAVLEARKGNANVLRTALVLPHSLFLDQSHIGTICTRPQLASQTCPKASVYGRAEAKSPLLDGKLKGKVYLVSSNNPLPDLLADLRGQVNIRLRGVISSKRGGLKTVFNNLPDVPVSKFILNMSGGEKSLLVNSTNLCKAPQQAFLNMKGQNGKKLVQKKYRLNVTSCRKSGK
jgi:hypothetical protein